MARENLIGVVTVTYNSAEVLPAFLRCMAAQTQREYILFAVDNASKDETTRILRECNQDRLRIICNSENRGIAEGNNQGIRAALKTGCQSVMLINNDTEFGPTLIAQLDEGLAANRVEMTCPKIVYHDEPERIWAAGGKFQPWLGYRSIHLGEGEIDRGQHNVARLVTYVPTCCVLIKQEVFQKVGLMDERYFVYVDDVDFMYRAMKAGVKLMYLPQAKLQHKVGGLSGGEDSPFAIQYGTRNRAFFLLKHFGVAYALPWMLVRQAYYFWRFLVARKGLEWLWLKERSLWQALEMYARCSDKRYTNEIINEG
jgi:GT2 family glycosyltransferase